MMKQTFTLLITLLLSIAAEAQTEPAKVPSSGAAGGKTIVTVSKSTPELPRKSEGDVVELTDGRLLLVSMEFGGDGSDFATTRLVAHESSDGGLTWGGHRVITDTAPGDVNVYSPNLIRAKDGGILLIFHRLHGKVGSGYSYTLHAGKSADEGKTFSPLAEFAARKDFALCNATVKRLASGRLLLPVSPAVPGDHGPWGKYAATVLYSDDDGRTWTEAANRLTLSKRGAMEPHVEQAGDGRVLMVMRNQLGTLHLSESTDDGVHWSEPKSIGLTSPESCPELTRIPATGDLLMIWNHSFDPDFRSHYGKRSPLTAAVSKDHGRTWQHVRDIETDPQRAFSNPGCRFTRDGRAILNYWTCEYLPDWRMQDVIDLRVAVIDTAWFYGEPVGASAPQDIEWSIAEWSDALIPAYPGWARWLAIAHWTAMAEGLKVEVWPGWRGPGRDGWVSGFRPQPGGPSG
jgi:sialidase-1